MFTGSPSARTLLGKIAGALAVVASLGVAAAADAAPVTITFDDLGVPPGGQLGIQLAPTEVGMGFVMWTSIRSPSGSTVLDVSPQWGGDPTFRLLTSQFPGDSLVTTMQREDGTAFSLLDLKYHGWNLNAAPSLTVTGMYAAGGTITESFAITNTLTDPFQSAFFSSLWSGLSSVTFGTPVSARNAIFQLDDIRVDSPTSPVPLPAAVWLILSAMGGLRVMSIHRPRT